MTPTRRSFFASLAALVVAPKVLKRTPRIAAYVPRQDELFGHLRALVDDGTFSTSLHIDGLPDRIRFSDLHEAHLRLHVEDLRTGFEPMTPWVKAREYSWRRHLRQHELAMERVSSKRDIEGGWTL